MWLRARAAGAAVTAASAIAGPIAAPGLRPAGMQRGEPGRLRAVFPLLRVMFDRDA